MKIAFAGTRRGMTLEQKTVLLLQILEKQPTEFHHGDHLGADAEAHRIIQDNELLGLQNVCEVVIHPLSTPKCRAFCQGDVLLPEKPCMLCDQDIVNVCDMLISCPDTNQEEIRSHTWAITQYAMKQRKPVLLITPSGTTKNL